MLPRRARAGLGLQRDPHKQFAAIQRRLSNDALQEYTHHTSSGLFAVPRGLSEGQALGAGLLS